MYQMGSNGKGQWGTFEGNQFFALLFVYLLVLIFHILSYFMFFVYST